MSAQSGYRPVCRLCQSVLVSSMPHGRFDDYRRAVKAMQGHLLYTCDAASSSMSNRERELVAEDSIEVVEGVA